MDITFVTTAKTDAEAYELLKAFGMPFVKRQEVIQTAA
jgi:large subunit ribosomal protein L5